MFDKRPPERLQIVIVEIRNKIPIGLRAILHELDPQTEYDRFNDAGAEYFLEYPNLSENTAPPEAIINNTATAEER